MWHKHVCSYTTQDEGCILLACNFLPIFFLRKKGLRSPTEIIVAPNIAPPIKMKMSAITEIVKQLC